ncbi:zinc finger, CCHC-type containing protein [Tanacetum coccineum]
MINKKAKPQNNEMITDSKGIHVTDDLQLVDSSVSNFGLKDSHQWVNSSVSLFGIEPSACILFNAAAMKHMASNFAKLDKFEGVDFRRWQKKMHFLLSSMSVVYVLTTPTPEDGGDDATVEQIRKRAKWDNDDYIYRGLILNGMSYPLFDIYQNVKSFKELWDSLEAKYMAEDASSKKFTQHKMNMDEAIQVYCIIDKLFPFWKDFKHTLKHKKDELTLVELGSHLRIEESLKVQDSDKPKSNNVASPSVVNMVEHNNSTRTELRRIWGEAMLTACNLLIRVPNKRNKITPYELWTKKKPNLNYLKVWGCRTVIRIPDRKLKTLGKRGIECIFVGYSEHSIAFRFHIPRPSLRIPNRTEDIGRSVDDPKHLMKKEVLRMLLSGKEDMGEANVILVSTLMDTSEKLMPNNGQAVSQLEYSRVIGCLMYDMTCTRPDITFVMGKLSMYTSNHGTQHWQEIQQISNSEYNSSTNGWVFLLGGGVISWASKKQTCITSSIMESEFVALAAAGKEAKCQMYNGKSRHLGVRHSMIHELITNGVVSIEFARSQRNLADHLTKGFARDLVLKSTEGMGLKSKPVA